MDEQHDHSIDKIADLLYSGSKIKACKVHMQLHGTTLSEAKVAVEQLQEDLRTKHPERFQQSNTTAGCFGMFFLAALIGLGAAHGLIELL